MKKEKHSNINHDWEGSLDKKFMARIAGPLTRPGVIDNTLSRSIYSRSNFLIRRHPILKMMLERFDYSGSGHVSRVPIVYHLRKKPDPGSQNTGFIKGEAAERGNRKTVVEPNEVYSREYTKSDIEVQNSKNFYGTIKKGPDRKNVLTDDLPDNYKKETLPQHVIRRSVNPGIIRMKLSNGIVTNTATVISRTPLYSNLIQRELRNKSKRNEIITVPDFRSGKYSQDKITRYPDESHLYNSHKNFNHGNVSGNTSEFIYSEEKDISENKIKRLSGLATASTNPITESEKIMPDSRRPSVSVMRHEFRASSNDNIKWTKGGINKQIVNVKEKIPVKNSHLKFLTRKKNNYTEDSMFQTKGIGVDNNVHFSSSNSPVQNTVNVFNAPGPLQKFGYRGYGKTVFTRGGYNEKAVNDSALYPKQHTNPVAYQEIHNGIVWRKKNNGRIRNFYNDKIVDSSPGKYLPVNALSKNGKSISRLTENSQLIGNPEVTPNTTHTLATTQTGASNQNSGIDIKRLAEKVSRIVFLKLSVERERRGLGRWY